MIDRRALIALRAKYLEMKRLRLEDEAGVAADPRPAMRALASRFPGALREIDELSLETIDARVASLDRAIERDEPEPWMIALCRYHAWLRLALALRRGVAGERTQERARAWLAGADGAVDPDRPPPDTIDEETLAAILRPPGGRLSRVVLLRVAAELDVPAEWVESLLHDPNGRRRH